jgi:hypothetical protein
MILLKSAAALRPAGPSCGIKIFMALDPLDIADMCIIETGGCRLFPLKAFPDLPIQEDREKQPPSRRVHGEKHLLGSLGLGASVMFF